MLADLCDQRFAERFQFRVADAVDGAKLVPRRRPDTGDFAQRLVAEDDVWRYTAMLGLGAPPDAQPLEQLAVMRLQRIERRRAGRRSRCALVLLSHRRLPQLDLGDSLHRVAGARAEAMDRVLVISLAKKVLRDQVINPFALLVLGRRFQQTKRRQTCV